MLKVGVQSAGWYDKNEPMKSFEYIKSCGFEATDFNIDHYLNTGKLDKEGLMPTFFDKSTEEILEFFTPLKEASEATGVAIAQMHAPFPVWFKEKDEVNDYIRSHFGRIKAHANAVEQRLDDSGLEMDALIAENKENLRRCREQCCDYILIDGDYRVDFEIGQ